MPPNLDNFKLRKNKPNLEIWFLMKFINNALINYKTSLGGLTGILGGLLSIVTSLQDGFQMDDWKVISAGAAAVGLGWGNLFGKDADVSNAPHPLKEGEKVD